MSSPDEPFVGEDAKITIDGNGSVFVAPPKVPDPGVKVSRLMLLTLLAAIIASTLATIVALGGWYSAATERNDAQEQLEKHRTETRCQARAGVDLNQAAYDLEVVGWNGINTIQELIIASASNDSAAIEQAVMDLRASAPLLADAVQTMQVAVREQRAAFQECVID